MPLIFVYGTLKRGDVRAQHLNGQRFLGEAFTAPRYRLYDCGTYPGLVEATDGGRSVEGEVYEVDEDCLAALDDVEGVDERLYTRRSVRLLPPFDRYVIETYIYGRTVVGLRDCGSCWKPVRER